MVNSDGTIIKAVVPDSIADQLGIEAGDCLLSINDQSLADFIDYLVLSSETELKLEILKPSGELQEIEFEKDEAEPIGLSFADLVFDGIRTCNNQCLFCFVNQMPGGQRPSLYTKDDDYRLSFLLGSYITLTNLTAAEWARIKSLHLSPLYISVHATNSVIRQKLLGSKKADGILEQLTDLAAAGLTMHTQAVICPGINDGQALEETISDLAKLWPQVASLAIVPVGLTASRRQLFEISGFKQQEAVQVLEIVSRWQQRLLTSIGTRFVFAADEWYIQSGQELPGETEYEDYLQLDNGVGLLRKFQLEFAESLPELAPQLQDLRLKLILVTGLATKILWGAIIKSLGEQCPAIQLETLPVINSFFGASVDVTGLLCGSDISQAIRGHQADPETIYLIPQITLRQGEDVFLDGLSLEDLKVGCQPKRVMVVPTGASDWLESLTGLEEDK